MSTSDDLRLAAERYPTDALSWIMATCSHKLRERLASRFRKAGLNVTPEQWAILGQLWEEDGVSQQAVADRFFRSKVAAFQLINKLEKQGLVERRPDPQDGRANLVFLTPLGRAMKEPLVAVAEDNMRGALEGISEEELEAAKAVVRKILRNIGA